MPLKSIRSSDRHLSRAVNAQLRQLLAMRGQQIFHFPPAQEPLRSGCRRGHQQQRGELPRTLPIGRDNPRDVA